MLLKSVVIKEDNLTTVNESCTLEKALSILEDSDYRCIPILDEFGKIFRGNIYKIHTYRHKANGGDVSLPAIYLLKNATRLICANTSFFKIFFIIKELPYIAVLGENDCFHGILTRSTLLNILVRSWNVK